MSRRASLPGAEELFRRTGGDEAREVRPEPERGQPDDKSTSLQPGEDVPRTRAERRPKHQEKLTIYCRSEDLIALERVRLRLRSEFGVAADRGRIVRAALGYILDDFEARGQDSILLRRLTEETRRPR